MSIQNYLLCILYAFLIIAHSFTLTHRDFYRGLISIFSFALITQTISTVLFTLHQTVITYSQQLLDLTDINPSPIYNIHYIAQLIHITSLNFFILFLLIVAKGWPITRRDMPFKYTFAIFWIMCLAADLITFYWATITFFARNFTHNYDNNNTTTISTLINNSSQMIETSTIATTLMITNSSNQVINLTNTTTNFIESLPNDTEQFNSTPRRLSLLLRIVIMLYFLLELRTTMILEQEQKKLQFYLHFGALSMVWFVHSLIVYVISLRVEIVWQSKLISGFTSAANFLAFAVTTRLLWPKSSRSYLFRKQKKTTRRIRRGGGGGGVEAGDGGGGRRTESECRSEDDSLENDNEYDGLEMRDLSVNK